MIKVIRFELIKLFSSKKFYIIGVLVLMLCALMAFGIIMIDTTGVPYEKISMNGLSFPLFLLSQLTDFLMIVLIVLTGGLIADDYKGGTLKQTLIKPIRRSDLIIGKASVVVVSTVCYLTIVLLAGYVMGALVFGWGSEIIVNGTEISFSVADGVVKTLLAYALTAIPIIAFLLFVLLFSLIMTNGGMVIGAGIGTLLVLQIISAFVGSFNKYIINYYFQIGRFYLSGFEGISVFASLLVPIGYILVLGVILLNLFNKKDIVY